MQRGPPTRASTELRYAVGLCSRSRTDGVDGAIAVRAVIEEIQAGTPVSGSALVLCSVAGVFALLSFSSRNALFSAAREIEYEIRGGLFAHLQRMPQSYFAGQRTGDLMSRAVNDVNNVRMFLGMGLLNVVQTPVLYVGAIAVMLHVDWRLTLWVLSPYPLFILVARLFGRRMHNATLETQEQLGALSSTAQENAAGVFVVRSSTMEDRERARFGVEAEALYRKQMHLAVVNNGSASRRWVRLQVHVRTAVDRLRATIWLRCATAARKVSRNCLCNVWNKP
jgi:ABC-type multidrug transport system fused ATPase/permease subunit